MVSRRKLLTLLPSALIAVVPTASTNLASSLPSPKFAFGQQVCCQWINDDDLDPEYGTTYRDYGVVIGMVWQFPQVKAPGWVYWVKWLKLSSPVTVPLPFGDWAIEEDLSLIL